MTYTKKPALFQTLHVNFQGQTGVPIQHTQERSK